MPKLPDRPPPKRVESVVLAEVRAALSAAGILHWRNNVGALHDETGRVVTYGLCEGSADLIAVVPIAVQFDASHSGFVGRFVAIEVKGPQTPVSSEQRDWLALVERAGGVSGIARSAADAMAIVERARRW